MRADATNIADRENWTGGYYELSMRLGASDDGRLDAAVQQLWIVAGLKKAKRRFAAGTSAPEVSAAGLVAGTLSTVATVPGSGRCVVAVRLVRDRDTATSTARSTGTRDDWLDLSIPVGSLERANPRVRSYPFGDDLSSVRSWRAPIDEWFFRVARGVHEVVPIQYAVTGFEVSGMQHTPQEAAGRIGLLVAVDGQLNEHPVR